MLHRTSPFRFLLTVLLAVTVPFCCCDFHSVLSACAACESPATGREAHTQTHDHADGAGHQHASTHHQKGDQDTPGDDHHGTIPDGPNHEKHDCTCDSSSGTMLSVEKSTVELPALVVVAVIDWVPLADLVPDALFRVHEREQRAVQRPPTSLLRLHCALIV